MAGRNRNLKCWVLNLAQRSKRKTFQSLQETFPSLLIPVGQHVFKEGNNFPQFVFWKIGSGPHFDGPLLGFPDGIRPGTRSLPSHYLDSSPPAEHGANPLGEIVNATYMPDDKKMSN